MFKIMLCSTYEDEKKAHEDTYTELRKEIKYLEQSVKRMTGKATPPTEAAYYEHIGWKKGIQEGMDRRISKAKELETNYQRSLTYLTDKVAFLESRLKALKNYATSTEHS